MNSLGTQIIKSVRDVVRNLGWDIVRYNRTPSSCIKLLRHHGVDVVLDVGANRGQYAQNLFEDGYTGDLISFEPQSSAHAILLEASTGNLHWTVAERCAIGDENGEVSINISENSVSSSILPMTDTVTNVLKTAQYVDCERVPVRTLDSLTNTGMLDPYRSPFLKMDVQGLEDKVLKGASSTIPRLVGIQSEMSLAELYEGQVLFPELMREIMQVGFELHCLEPVFDDPSTGRLLQVDAIFFRRSKT